MKSTKPFAVVLGLLAAVLGLLIVFALSLPVMAQSTTQSTTTTTRHDSPTQSTTTITEYPAYSPEAPTTQTTNINAVISM
jgi:hypothetical protein